MPLGWLDNSYTSLFTALVWVGLPLYGALAGLVALSPAQTAAAAQPIGRATEGTPLGTGLINQAFLLGGALLTALCFRGLEGPFFQGQLSLSLAALKLSTLAASFLYGGLLLALPIALSAEAQRGALGLQSWHLAPVLIVGWGLLPFATQITSALLVLELVGVGLIWALTSLAAPSNPTVGGAGHGPGSLVYAIVLFVWASGLSALGLLVALGLNGLNGGFLNFLTPLDPSATSQGLVEALLAIVLAFKFLVGGGQFILLAWYRFLPANGLVFYLLFYYPAHLLLGTTFFAGFFLPAAVVGVGFAVGGLGLALLALLPSLGAQTSPALTLGGSSFVGLSFLAVALLNVV